MGDLNDNRPNKENEYNTNIPSCSLYLRKITKTEIYKIITDTNNNSAPGSDRIRSKAFDSISHSKLLNCIKSFSIIGSAYSIFKSYLEGRTQQVKISDNLSDIGKIHRGVPQGTVLSPILYIMYVAALDRLSLNGKTIRMLMTLQLYYPVLIGNQRGKKVNLILQYSITGFLIMISK